MPDPSSAASDGEEADAQQQLLQDAAAAMQKTKAERDAAKPHNVVKGAARLVGDTLSGAAAGAAAVVSTPVAGYKAAGVKGAVGGAVGGLALGVSTAVAGLGSGVTHFAQGAAHSVRGSHTEKDERLIVGGDDVPLDRDAYVAERAELYGELLDESGDTGANGTPAGVAAPVDTSLYDALEVAPDATPAQIRKAYYKLAQRYHPDKHPDDPDATAKFQIISQAYQVLCDPAKREKYHRVGLDAADDDAAMDPKALFVLMFADFEHLVGDLATATLLRISAATAAAEGGSDADATAAHARVLAAFQRARELRLSALLARRLAPWLEGADGEAAVIAHAKHEVVALRTQPFGRDCLRTVSRAYRDGARRATQCGPARLLRGAGEYAHGARSRMRAVKGAAAVAAAPGDAAADGETIDETARREAVNAVGAVWLMAVVDIENTLRAVVDAVLHAEEDDDDKSEDVRKKADALLVLGKIFHQA